MLRPLRLKMGMLRLCATETCVQFCVTHSCRGARLMSGRSRSKLAFLDFLEILVCFDFLAQTLVCFCFLDRFSVSFDFVDPTKNVSTLFNPVQIFFGFLDQNTIFFNFLDFLDQQFLRICFVRPRIDTFRLSLSKIYCFVFLDTQFLKSG